MLLIDLVEVDPAAEPSQRAPDLLLALALVGRPDLREDADGVTMRGQRAAQDPFGRAVHRRGVERRDAGLARRRDDGARGVLAPGGHVERPPGAAPASAS